MDVPYILLYLILVLFVIRNKANEFYIACFIVFVFYAFRAPTVGGDTYDYVSYLAGEKNYYNNDSRELERGFVIFRNFISELTSSRFVILNLITLLSLSPVYLIIKRFSSHKTLSILLFFLLDICVLYMGAFRQVLALSLLLWSLLIYESQRYSLKVNCILLLLFSIIAWTIHTSSVLYAAIFVLSYIIPIQSKNIYYLAIVSSALLGIILNQYSGLDILNYYVSLNIEATSRLDGIVSWELYDEYTGLNVLLRLSVVGIINTWLMPDKYINHPFMKIFTTGIVIFNMFTDIPMVHRMIYPLSLFGIITFSWCFEKEESAYSRNFTLIRKWIPIILIAYLCQSVIRNSIDYNPYSEARMHPYLFIFQDYSKNI